MSDSSQKFIARNRAPRVQIEYDVELYGSEKKVQLPFVTGVMSDLAGKSHVEQPAIADRKFVEIDIDNFDDRMKAMAPRVAFSVPNTLTGEGNLPVDLTFEKLDDFSPTAIASRVDALRPLLEARTQLATLMAYMDGKSGAEGLIEKILADPALLKALAGTATGDADQAAALDSLRALTPPEPSDETAPADVLNRLRAEAPPQEVAKDESAAALEALRTQTPPAQPAPDPSEDVLSALRSAPPSEDEDSGQTTRSALDALRQQQPDPEDTTDDLLADLATSAPEETPAQDTTDDLLADLATSAPEETPTEDTTDELLADLATSAPEETPTEDTTDDLDDLLGSAGGDDDPLADLLNDDPAPAPEPAGDDLDDLLGGSGDDDDPLADLLGDDPAPEPEPAGDDLDDLLGSAGGDDDPLADLLNDDPAPEPEPAGDDLDDLLGGAGGDDDPLADLLGDDPAPEPEPAGDDLDDLLGGPGDDDDPLADLLGDDPAPEPEPAGDDLGDLLGGAGDDDDPLADLLGDDPAPEPELAGDDLDDLLGDLDVVAPSDQLADTEFAFGTITADRPSAEQLNRKRFRMAIFGDFSGRAARGRIETGDALAARKAILLDPDTAEDVIEGFATDLVLPIGPDGGGIAVSLSGLDDLHPDELYENLPIFAELVGLRQQLSSGATAENAVRRLRDWGETYGTPVTPPRSSSGGNTVRADLKLSAFQQLIGDTSAVLSQASPIDEMIAQVVGPHIRAVPDADAQAMIAAVDQALSAAMRLVLHHPEFQQIEAQWRSIDLIARSVEVDDTLEVMLYDVSAEEIAADLASADDLSQSGFIRLLTEEPLDEENGRGGYSALIGLYNFEETPPHAELLGRIGRAAAHVDAPFIASISPAFLDTPKKDRHPLVATAWDTLRAMPEAGHLALASPRFLLRRPYGAKSEPIYEFEFEEFSMEDGLKGMLWANPVVLVAILLAKSFKKNGASMGLGSVMSLGGMPYHYVTDRHGDQVALPCTERNLTESKVEIAAGRGIMPVVSIKGRDEVRLASFRSLAGDELRGPWSGVAPPEPSPPKPAPPPDAEPPEAADVDAELDDLLAGFDDTATGGDDDGDIDADLAALLDDL